MAKLDEISEEMEELSLSEIVKQAEQASPFIKTEGDLTVQSVLKNHGNNLKLLTQLNKMRVKGGQFLEFASDFTDRQLSSKCTTQQKLNALKEIMKVDELIVEDGQTLINECQKKIDDLEIIGAKEDDAANASDLT